MHATVSIRPPPPGHPPKRFFAVSIPKLIVMSVCTFGSYEIYWFYEHWDEVKNQTRENLWPFWRAFFSPLFCYSLFTRIKETSSTEGVRSRYPLGLDAFIWIALVATGYYEFLIIPFLTFLPLVHVQRQVNELHRKVAPRADKNARFSGLNIAAIAVGGGLILTTSVFNVLGIDFNRTLGLNRSSAEALNNRGEMYGNQGQYDLAIAEYNRALELNPRYAEAFNNRGAMFANKGQYDLAFADFNRAVELNPRYAEAFNNRGFAYGQQGQWDEAIADINRALELNPRYAMAYNNRGWYMLMLEDTTKVCSDAKRGCELGVCDLSNETKSRGVCP